LDFNTFKTNNDDDNLNYRIPDSTWWGNRAKAIPAWVLACMAIIPLVMSGINNIRFRNVTPTGKKDIPSSCKRVVV
jgi:hypothetical protein